MINKILGRIGFQLVKKSSERSVKYSSAAFCEYANMVLEQKLETTSMSQLAQDFMVASLLNFKPGGYFVEFGATNGKELSNTYLLEKELNWTGILAEPNPRWHPELLANRNCHISKDCVWLEDGKTILFHAAEQGEFGTISEFKDSDTHRTKRNKAQQIEVPTVKIETLLNKFNAPAKIDYVSIDTEGSELQILETFPFDKYDVKFFTIEHNFGANEVKIDSILRSKGFQRIMTGLSKFDGWYIKTND